MGHLKYIVGVGILVILGFYVNKNITSFVFVSKTSAKIEEIHAVQVQLWEDGLHFNGTVSINDKLWSLKLKTPDKSAFGKNFRLHIQGYSSSYEPSASNIDWEITPSKTALDAVEKNVYIDKESDAALKVQVVQNDNKDNGQKDFRLHGFINGYHITHDGSKHVAQHVKKLFPRQNKQTANIQTPFAANSKPVLPVIASFAKNTDGIERNAKTKRENTNKSAFVNPEILFFLDNKMWALVGENEDKMLDYLAVFVHSMNNRYSHIKDPKIVFSIVGAVALTSRSKQVILEKNKVSNESYDLLSVLSDFGSFMYKERDSFVSHDIAALISGEEFVSKGASGEFEKGFAGLAFVGGSCRVDDVMKVAYNTLVINDGGAAWLGVHTAVHEFAHSLGATHDGKSQAEKCSWEDGYIMSYEGDGERNKFYFSKCSQDLMKKFINSQEGKCLHTENSAMQNITSMDFPGDRVSMDEQCKLGTGKKEAMRDDTKTESEQCRRLYCKYQEPCGKKCIRTYKIALGSIPGDYTPCGKNGGHCINGECVTKK